MVADADASVNAVAQSVELTLYGFAAEGEY